MAGTEERVKGFLESWPIIEEQLDKLLEELIGSEPLTEQRRPLNRVGE